jgi:hypothetical protein
MITRFGQVTPETYTYQYFPDITGDFWAAPLIAGAAKAGILD